MNTYKLLTPGPLTTSDSVKEEMLVDHCTWDDEYKSITREICSELLDIAEVDSQEYAVVLMQGSGTFGVESVLTSIPEEGEKVLVLSNGAYGERMVEILEHAKIPYHVYYEEYNHQFDSDTVERIIDEDPAIQYIAMVHNETTTGMLNDIKTVGSIANDCNITFIVDAMSSFGGMKIDIEECHIDFLISSSNKCIQGVPGFSFIIADKEKLITSEGNARSLSLDLFDQWKQMSVDGKWRFTSPTHAVLAFRKAIEELRKEGGVVQRSNRYQHNNLLLVKGLNKLGFKSYIEYKDQGPIITTFYYPEDKQFNFKEMYDYIKERGYVIYPGKLTDVPTFRVGNIGEIYPEDIENICHIFASFIEEKEHVKN